MFKPKVKLLQLKGGPSTQNQKKAFGRPCSNNLSVKPRGDL